MDTVILFMFTCFSSMLLTTATTGREENVSIRYLMERLENQEKRYMKEIHTLSTRLEYVETTLDESRSRGRLGGVTTDGTKQRGEEQMQIPQRSSSSHSSNDKRSNTRRERPDRLPAFFATLADHMYNITYNQSIAFENVITNIGQAYNPSRGVFTAPVAGTYVFSTSLMTYSIHNAHYIIGKNGVAQSYMYVRGSESPSQTTSQTALLDLDAGDDVEVMCIDQNVHLNGYGYSSFAGFLLQERFNGIEVVG